MIASTAPCPDDPGRAWLEVCLSTGLIGLIIGAGAFVPQLDEAAVAAGAMLLWPVLVGRWRQLPFDVLGWTPTSARSVLVALLVAVVVLPPFSLGFSWLQTGLAGREMLAPAVAWPSRGGDWQVEPAADVPLAVFERGPQTILANRTARRWLLSGEQRCAAPPCQVAVVAPGRTVVAIEAAAVGGATVRAPDGSAPADGLLRAGRDQHVLGDGVVPPRAGWTWLLGLLATQLLLVALPEEAFFRGYVLTRLQRASPGGWFRLAGVPWGAADVAAAGLFAAVHLVAIPSPGRLLVFFPGLLFGWVARRTGSSVGPAVLHALCNVCLELLLRCLR